MYYQIYRREGGQKVIVGFASNSTQAALIMQAEREKIDDEYQVGIELIKEENDGVHDEHIGHSEPSQGR